MAHENQPGVDWLVLKARAGDVTAPEFHPVLDAYRDLLAREQRAGVPAGTPILVSPDFDWDSGLALYFNTAIPFIGFSASAKLADARAIKRWLTYLDSQEVHWLSAQDAHYVSYRSLRTDPDVLQDLIDAGAIDLSTSDSLRVLENDSWLVTWEALKRLYKWAGDKGLLVGYSPIPETERSPRSAARNAPPKAQWLLPDAYRLWRDVGLGGCALTRSDDGQLAAGEHDSKWKGGVVASRNMAFVDLLVGTGLRLTAAASILMVELPEPGANDRTTRTANAVNKFKRGYAYEPPPQSLAQIAAYQRFGRRAAVRRAQAEGRYDESRAIVITRAEHRSYGMVLHREDGGPNVEVERADFGKRERLYTRDADGRLEPMLLWLSEEGTPLAPSAWQDVFKEANKRVKAAYRALGATSPVRVNAHMLRFSFALWFLIKQHMAIDEAMGYSPYDAYDPERYGAAYYQVQVALNHKEEQTTLDTYLEPMKGLRAVPKRGMFAEGLGRDLSDLIGHYVIDSDRIVRLNHGGA